MFPESRLSQEHQISGPPEVALFQTICSCRFDYHLDPGGPLLCLYGKGNYPRLPGKLPDNPHPL